MLMPDNKKRDYCHGKRSGSGDGPDRFERAALESTDPASGAREPHLTPLVAMHRMQRFWP